MATEAAAPDPAIASAPGWDSESHPWRRYGARMIDLTVFGFSFFFLLGFPLAFVSEDVLISLEQPSWLVAHLVIHPMVFAATGAATALCVARWESTPGKWLFGLKVVTAQGERLTLRQALTRELHLFWWGVGFGVVVISLVMMIRSFNEVETKHLSRWDAKAGSTVRARTLEGRTYAGVVIGAILVILLKVWDAFERFLALGSS